MQLELPIVNARNGLRQALAWLQESLDCTYWTRRMHADHARYLIEFFGDVPVCDVRYPQLREYFDREKRRGVAKETIRKRLCTLKMALREACAHGVLERLPEWPVIRTDVRPKDAFWTRTQWEAAHLACDDEELRVWIANGWWSGMHSSDLDRFRWQDVDLVRGTWIRRNTKSKSTPSVMPIPARWLEVLRERYEAVQPHPRDLIAGRRMGHPNRVMKYLSERAGVPPIGPIGLRHSCETYLHESGADDLFQQTWLGHKSIRMIKRHYRHVTDPTIERGLAALNAHN